MAVSLDERGRRNWAATESRADGYGGDALVHGFPRDSRGKPLRTFETVVDLIGNTRIAAGLRVKTQPDKIKYPAGEAVTNAEMDALSLHRNEFRDDWSCELRPR